MANVDITISNVDPNLLREQRNAVLGVIDKYPELIKQADSFGALISADDHIEALEGLVNMLDHILDLAEGYKTGAEQTIL